MHLLKGSLNLIVWNRLSSVAFNLEVLVSILASRKKLWLLLAVPSLPTNF